MSTLLGKLPANTPAERAELDGLLTKLGPAGIEQLCALLVDPGTGDDTQPRMALHALAYVARQPGNEALCRDAEQVLSGRLASPASPAVKSFLIEQLALFAGPDVVPALGALLADNVLASDAVRALAALDGVAARRALRQALPTAGDQARVAIIDALGVMRDAAAGTELLKLAASEDLATRLAVRSALAEIGDPAAGQLLAGALGTPQSPEEQSATLALNLRFARRLVETGHKEMAVVILRTIQKTGAEDTPPHIRSAVLAGLAEALGASAVDDVVQALTDDDPAYRSAANDVAAALVGPRITEAFVARLKPSAPLARAGILSVLARRGDAAALPAAVEALRDGDPAVRQAAIPAVATLGKEEAVVPLTGILVGATPEDRKSVQAALTGIPGNDASQRIAEAIATSSGDEAATTLLDVLATRRATLQLAAVQTALACPREPVRVAAVRALGVMADESAVADLLDRLPQSASPQEREALEDALARCSGRAKNRAEATARVLAAVRPPDTANYVSLIHVLARLGGDEAQKLVRAAADDAREEVQDAAYRAWSDWPDPAPATAVLEIARTVTDLKLHVLAMRACERFIGMQAGSSPSAALSLAREALQNCRRPDERKAILARLGDVRDAGALPVLEAYLADETLGAEAAAALLGVADKLLPGGWAQAQQAAEKILAAPPTDALRTRAEEVLKRCDEHAGFVCDWLVIGPFEVKDKRGFEILDTPFPPETTPDRTAPEREWRKQPTSDDPNRYWFLDLNASVNGPDRAGYLRTWIHAPSAQDVILGVGSDDGVKVWLNGTQIHVNNIHRGCEREQDKVPAALKEGANELLLKVTNDDGGYGASVRLCAPDGRALRGVQVSSQPPGPVATPAPLPTPSPEMLERVTAAAPAEPVVRPERPRKLLVCNLARGYRHESIPLAAETLVILGRKTGAFEAVIRDDAAMFEPQNLLPFDAICFNNTTGDLFDNPRLKQALVDFVRGGRGLIGIHAATDCFYNWPEFGAMMGGYFDGHPWNETVTVKIDEPDHPLNAAFAGRPFAVADEIYQFREPYTRERLRVLLSLDTKKTDMTKPEIKRTDGDFAVSWVQEVGAGRVFYCSLGHRNEIFWTPDVLRHYLAGIQYALGDLPADAMPVGGKPAAPPAIPPHPAPQPGKLPPGWTSLSDGRDLAGWKGRAGDPPALQTMKGDELARAQKAADEKMRAHWRIEDGVLVFDGQGESIVTAKDYGDFELRLDWRIGPGGDSGVYLRGTPQVQIWDPAQWPEGSGGLYNNRRHPAKPLVRADRPVGQWNAFQVRMVGDSVTVHLNDVLVVDEVPLENYWDRDKPLPARGPLELQSHGSRLEFRNIAIREIPADEVARTPPRPAWRELFNGRDFTGWSSKPDGWSVVDGALTRQAGGDIWTTEQFGDFVLDVEFKFDKGANSGIFFRTANPQDCVQTGIEMQVLDSFGKPAADLHDCGAIYDCLAPSRNAVRPPGEWNHAVLTCRGPLIQVRLNGEQIIAMNLDDWTQAGQNPDGSPNKFRTAYREMPRVGYIGFQDHGNPVAYRNVRIRPLQP